jgi:hypothetical protein
MEPSPTWEADSSSAVQGLTAFYKTYLLHGAGYYLKNCHSACQKKKPASLWNPRVHYRAHKNPPLHPVLSQPNPVRPIDPYLPKTHLNVILPPTPRARKLITLHTKSHHLTLPPARCIHRTSSKHYSLIFVLISSFHLRPGLRNGVFLSDFATKIWYAFPISTMLSTRFAHLILLELITLII